MASSSGRTAIDYKVGFGDLCEIYAAKKARRGSKEKGTTSEVLRSFIKAWRTLRASYPGQGKDQSFFPFMRLMLPGLDTSRQSYGLKENSLAQIYVLALGLNQNKGDGRRIILWENPEENGVKAGNFPLVLSEVLSNGHVGSDIQTAGRMSVGEVNDMLDHLSKISNAGLAARHGKRVATENGEIAAQSRSTNDKGQTIKQKRAALLQSAIRRLTASDNQWLASIIIKNSLRCGLGEKLVFGSYHPDASTMWNHCQSLKKVCDDLDDPRKRLNNIAIELMVPFKPMLAERMEKTSKILTAVQHKGFLIETKFDGERMQLHKRGNEYVYYSRRGNNFTFAFGANPSEGTFTPYAHKLFHDGSIKGFPRVSNCIIDGEMMMYDVDEQEMKSMGEMGENTLAHNLTPKMLHKIRPMFIVFDVVYLNGEPIAEKPLEDRRKILLTLFREDPMVMTVAKIQTCEDKEGLEEGIANALDNQEEGIIVKKADSKYAVDGRDKMGWIKWKPEYVDSLSDHMDLVVIGGYYGGGSRGRGRISHFMLGAKNKAGLWQSFAKVGSGYNKKELVALSSFFRTKWRKFDTKKGQNPCEQDPPVFTLAMPGYKEKPDVWVHPHESLVLEVKAAEIFKCDTFALGLTIRFPRVVRLREDKSYDMATTAENLFDLFRGNFGKLTKRKAASEYLDEDSHRSNKKKRSGAVAAGASTLVASSVVPKDLSIHKTKSDIFAGQQFVVEFCNLSANEKVAKRLSALATQHGLSCTSPTEVMQRLIHMYGGMVCANFPSVKANCMAPFQAVIAEQFNVHAKMKVRAAATRNESIRSALAHIEAVDVEMLRTKKAKEEYEKALLLSKKPIVSCNVMRPEWVVKMIERGKWLTPDRVLSHHLSEETRATLSDFTDDFGDSYLENQDLAGLESILDFQWAFPLKRLRPQTFAQYEEELLSDDPTCGRNPRFLRRFTLHFLTVEKETLPADFELAEQLAIFYGANITKDRDRDDVSHMICHKSTYHVFKDELYQLNRNRLKAELPVFHVVWVEWILDSVSKKVDLDVVSYLCRT